MKILFATDGSPSSQWVARLLLRLADRTKNEITVLSISSPKGARWPNIGRRFDPETKHDAEELAALTAAELESAGFRTASRTAEGRPAEKILSSIESERYELTAIGAGHRRRGALLLGSVGNHVLHHSPSSVLIVRDEPPDKPKGNVLVGVEGSQEASRGVEVLLEFADPARCAVSVVAVAEVLAPTAFPPGHGYALSLPNPEDEAEMTSTAKGHAKEAADRLSNAGFSVERKVILGRAPDRLLAEAKILMSDIVAVGSRGHGAVDRTILGSVSEEVARSAGACLVARIDY